MTRETIVAADIGGTETRLLLYEVHTDQLVQPSQGQEAPGKLLLQKKYSNHDYKDTGFARILKEFLDDAYLPHPPLTACFAVAGPVTDNVVRFTNREWEIDGSAIEKQFRIRSVRLVNDFLANGYGLLTLDETRECILLQNGVKDPTAPKACIGPGTGLGECFLTPYGNNEYRCYPCEGGHAEYAPRNELEIGLLTFLKKRFAERHRVSVERVVSGTGLPNIFDYLCEIYPSEVNPAVKNEVDDAKDLKGKAIAKHAKLGDSLSIKTMEIFATAYGAEAGVAALKWLPYGGLYLTGGLTPKNIDLLRGEDSLFMQAFRDKGRVSGMLLPIPVYAVMAENLGQRGSHLLAYKELLNILGNTLLSAKAKDSVSSLNLMIAVGVGVLAGLAFASVRSRS